MPMKTYRYGLAVVCALISAAAFADTLYLHGGEEAQGLLKEVTNGEIVFEGRDGVKTWKKAEVIRVQLQQPRQFDEVERIEQGADPELKACFAHQPGADDFGADGAVILLQRHLYDLTAPGTLRETKRTIVKVLQQRGENNGTRAVWYFEDTDTARIDFALTLTPDGRILHLSDAALKDESIYASFPDYRRLSRLRFACKEPRAGSILDVQHTLDRRLVQPMESFYTEELFGESSPVLRKEVIVLIPAAREGELAAAISMPEALEASREVTGDVVKLTWRLVKPQAGLVEEPLMPPLRAIVPALTLAEKKTWQAVAAEYMTELDKLAPLSAEMKEKAVVMARKGGARAIYNYVTRDIRNAPVPHPHYVATPHAADESIRRGFANELDKNYLICTLLKAANIECALALVRGRYQGAIAEEAPSVRAFNRSAVYLPAEKLFVNTGSDLIEFGAMAGELYDAPALIMAPDTRGLIQTQTAPLDVERDETEFEAALDAEGNLEMTLRHQSSGDTGGWMRALKNMDQEALQNYLRQIAANLHPAAELTGFTAGDYADLSVMPVLEMKVRVPGYAMKAGEDLMLFHVPGVEYSASDVGRPTRLHDLFFEHGVRAVTRGLVRIPKEYKLYNVPEGVSATSDIADYRARLEKDGKRALRFEDEFVLKVPEAPKGAYGPYKAVREQRANLSRQRVVLMRK